MWLGYAMKDSSPAYLPSRVVEVMSWTANSREVASPQTVFHGLITELYLGNDQNYLLTNFARFRQLARFTSESCCIPRSGLVQPPLCDTIGDQFLTPEK